MGKNRTLRHMCVTDWSYVTRGKEMEKNKVAN